MPSTTIMSFDFSDIERRLCALLATAPHREVRTILYGMQYGMGAQRLRDEFAKLNEPLHPATRAAKLENEISLFEQWQDEEKYLDFEALNRQNAAIEYAAVEAGILAPFDIESIEMPAPLELLAPYIIHGATSGRFPCDKPNYSNEPRTATGRLSMSEPEMQEWPPRREPESDMERDRR